MSNKKILNVTLINGKWIAILKFFVSIRIPANGNIKVLFIQKSTNRLFNEKFKKKLVEIYSTLWYIYLQLKSLLRLEVISQNSELSYLSKNVFLFI